MNKFFRKLDHLLHPGKGEIWMLHRVVKIKSNNPYYHRWEISPAYLELLIRQYIDNGYRFVSIDEVCAMLRSHHFNKPFVCITFDDGHLDNITEALPILEKYNVPFCVYVTPGYVLGEVEPRMDEHIPMMTKEQVLQLAHHPLCTIGSHTMTHPHLEQLDYEQQKREIVSAKDLLEQWIGQLVVHFASPYGSYNEDTLKITGELNLQSHVDIWGGPVRKNSNAYCLPRIERREKG